MACASDNELSGFFAGPTNMNASHGVFTDVARERHQRRNEGWAGASTALEFSLIAVIDRRMVYLHP
jgi:hypothetical protein